MLLLMFRVVVASLLTWSSAVVLAEAPRAPWTTPYVTGTPEPPSPYAIERVYPKANFPAATDFALEPDTGRWFVLQQDGKIFAVDPAQGGKVTKVMDPADAGMSIHQAYGIEFHPNYKENREVYFAYAAVPEGDGRHVSRLKASTSQPAVIDPASEEILMTWFTMDHNGGNLQFGPDGMLYITSGDSAHAFPPDEFNAAQSLADVRGKILRIDVDRQDPGLPYAIPKDNPFVDVPGARGEIWTLGMRNPWKITFDRENGRLWCADVGWEMWELIYLLEKGGNYGWPIREGRQPVRTDVVQGPGEIIPPLVDHHHAEARSVTGGPVYRGAKLPDLHGAYIYGDWSTGIIWGLKYEDDQVVWNERLVDTPLAIISFGLDADGEMVIVDYSGGLYRLVPNSAAAPQRPFPQKLSETGLFASTAELAPAKGVIPYGVNAGLYHDGARSERYIAIPQDGSIPLPFIKYPQDTVFVKTLWMPGADDERVNLETQLLHFDGSEWRGYSYLWNDDQTDADLVPAEGTEKQFEVADESQSPRTLNWRVDNRANCMTCHGWIIGHVVGFNYANLDRPYDPEMLAKAACAGAPPHPTRDIPRQINLLRKWKIFDGDFFPQQRQPAMVDPLDEQADLEKRARSYLAINCAHCHRREGGGTARIELPFETPLDKINAIDEGAVLGTFDIPGSKVIASGRPEHSILYYRMATVGRGHMPHLGTRNVDEAGLALLRDWIVSLNPEAAQADKAIFESIPTTAESLLTLSAEERRTLLASTPASLRTADQIARVADRSERAAIAKTFISECPSHVRGLFERFLDPKDRIETLGENVDAGRILAMTGDVEAGRRIFFLTEGVSCKNCHAIQGEGKNVGPELTQIGSLRTREQILESILEPSRQIEQKFVNYAIQTVDGRVLTGLILSRTDDVIVLQDAAGQKTEIAEDDVEELVRQPRSLMPDLLVKELTAQDLADLLAYLTSLK